MKRQKEAGECAYWTEEDGVDYFREIDAEQKFFINDEGNIVISFEKYEVAAGLEGNPEIEIPHEIAADILK